MRTSYSFSAAPSIAPPIKIDSRRVMERRMGFLRMGILPWRAVEFELNSLNPVKDILGRAEDGVGRIGRPQNFPGQPLQMPGIVALRVVQDQVAQIGILMRRVELHGQVKKVDRLVHPL